MRLALSAAVPGEFGEADYQVPMVLKFPRAKKGGGDDLCVFAIRRAKRMAMLIRKLPGTTGVKSTRLVRSRLETVCPMGSGARGVSVLHSDISARSSCAHWVLCFLGWLFPTELTFP